MAVTITRPAKDVINGLSLRPKNAIKQVGNRYLERHRALKNERSSWESHYRELAENLLPKRGRFNKGDGNKGSKINSSIINSTPLIAIRTSTAGMHAGMSSPARPWFRLTTPDPGMAEFGPVRAWLHVVEERIRRTLLRSNIYNALPSIYADLNWAGTAACLIDEDEETTVRAYVFPTGSYCLANSARLQADTLYRELRMTTLQLVEKFELENVSDTVRIQYEEGHYDLWHDVVHVVEPNKHRDTERKDYRGKPWRSCWFEGARDPDVHGYLRESGYWDNPLLAPRWDVTGEDVYGRSPGMDALGDAKALQLLERRKAQVVDKIVNPPMKGPTSLLQGRATLLPGDVTNVDETAGGTKFEPAIIVNPQAIGVVNESIRDHEHRINQAFFADLWLMMAQSDRRQITAREIEERHEEKLLQLGPVLERLQDELFDPLIDRIFGVLLRRGDLPPPPKELSNVDLRVDYTSTLAQAQKLLGTASVERFASFAGSLVAAKPDVLDKVNTDELIDTYADMLGIKPDLVVADDVVAELRAGRAQAQQQQMALAQAQQAAQGAKVLSEADTESNNGLTTLMGALGGVGGGV